MREFGKRPWNRIGLYGLGGALVLLLLTAGVYRPQASSVECTVHDHEIALSLYSQSGAVAEAEGEIEEILALDPGNLYALLASAYLRDAAGDLEKAIALYEQSLGSVERAPQLEGEILETLGRICIKAKRYLEARDWAEERIARFGENNSSRLIIALSSLFLGDDKGFEENLSRIREWGTLDPSFLEKFESLIQDPEILDRWHETCVLARCRYEGKKNGPANKEEEQEEH